VPLVFGRIDEGRDVDAMARPERFDLMVRADLVPLVRRERNAVAEIEDVHGK
jgi:hypothetical protein